MHAHQNDTSLNISVGYRPKQVPFTSSTNPSRQTQKAEPTVLVQLVYGPQKLVPLRVHSLTSGGDRAIH